MASRRFHASVPSTQAEAIEWARRGAEPGSRVVARQQTHGIGRLDHRWVSPAGGLYLSVILDDPNGPAPLFTLAVGVKLLEQLRQRWGVETAVKWPNDLVAPSAEGGVRKLAGILVDRVETSEGAHRLVVGVGLNVGALDSDFPAELRGEVVGLSELAHAPIGLDEVEEAAAAAISAAHGWTAGRSDDRGIVEVGRELLFGIGRRARIDGRPVGIIRGIDRDGSLVVGDADRVEHITAGSVTIEEAA